ncbi:MAG: hypothetical protein K6T92_06265 [Candidatus Rokubacteria bacterium]|nr:hypothetical protein [Candidatus Rokubacteria bacterium]
MTTASSSPSTRGAGLASVLEILRRRRGLALVPFLFVLAAAASLAIFLPGLWTARAVIMVDRQQVPETMVKSTVTGEIEAQLITLSQTIMSPDRLAAIIQRYGLYPELRAREGMEAAVGRMRRDITIDFAGETDRRRREPRTVLFSVAYSNSDPRVTAAVANELAGLYVAENVRYREQAAAGTAEFLDKQLAELRPRLLEQERRIAAYKEQHLGELPEQKEANLRTLERLQQQLMLAHDNNRRANERRQLITQSLSQLDTSVIGPARGADVSPAAALAARLNILRQELAQLQSVYSDKYPDVVAVKEQIRTLEARLEEEKAREKKAAAAAARAGEGRELRAPPSNPYVASLMSQLDQANVEAKATAEEIANLNRQIAVYQRRLENTPKREQELAVLTRDYETTRELFRSLMAKREEAGIAADLEAVRKGETFRIVEAASVPQRPTGPNRWRLLLIGLVLAVGTSAIAVVLAEQVDTSYRTVDEVRASLPVPVLSTIPKITTERDRARRARQRRWATAAVAVGLLAVIGSSFAVARNNDALVSLLTPAPTPARR